jgi:hypothetical protein
MDGGSKNTNFEVFFKVIIWDQLMKVLFVGHLGF